jgi:O-acetylhomoserine (thiol)-lyase
MDRCPKIEFSRLFGELGWHGFDSGVISSRRARAGAAGPPGGPRFTGLETKAIHSGQRVDDTTGARITPIFQTASYVFEDVEHAASLFNLQTFGNVYSRLGNPTVAALEEKLAALEGGRGATCAASGHAAQLLVLFTLLRPGDRFVASRNLYGGSIAQFRKAGERFGWHCDFVDLEDRAAVRGLLEAPRCKLLWAESLANPGGVVSDIEWLSAECKRVRVPLCIDNTLATPALCRPGELGADIVCHSTTKFLSGHGNALGGAVVDIGRFDWSCDKGKYPSLSEPEPAYHGLTFHESFGDLALTTALHAIALRDLGPAMSPFNAFLTSMGVETLPLRMERHVRNALEVAAFLKQHPKVAYVSYAGLKESPFHERMLRVTRGRGAGSVFTFGLKGGFADGVRFVESLHLFSHLANVGDTRSLVLHPGSTTHRQLSEEQRRAAGAGDEVIRLSIGLESAHDLLLDLEQALAKL